MHAAHHAEAPAADPASAVTQLRAALGGNVAQFAQPRGPNLLARTAALETWCAGRAAHGLWQYARQVAGAPGPHVAASEDGGDSCLGINFASQDYLSLSAHPQVRAAAQAALERYGPHSASSAFLMGNSDASLALEAAIGSLLAAPHVTLFPTGWGAAFGAISALVHARDHVVIDQLAHASLRQGAACATRNVALHRHLDCMHVRELLAMIRARDTENGILVVTEGLFSMDADSPDLPLLQYLCREYDATLLVDVAHDLGALGPGGTGAIGQQGMLGKIDLVMGAFSKTFATNGGFVACAVRAVKRQLQLFGGPYLFSNALSPVQAATALAAVQLASSDEGECLRAALQDHALLLRTALAGAGVRCLGQASPIVAALAGSEAVLRLASRQLARQGVFVNAIEYPGVPLGAARLRLQLMAAHTPTQLEQGAAAVAAALHEAQAQADALA